MEFGGPLEFGGTIPISSQHVFCVPADWVGLHPAGVARCGSVLAVYHLSLATVLWLDVLVFGGPMHVWGEVARAACTQTRGPGCQVHVHMALEWDACCSIDCWDQLFRPENLHFRDADTAGQWHLGRMMSSLMVAQQLSLPSGWWCGAFCLGAAWWPPVFARHRRPAPAGGAMLDQVLPPLLCPSVLCNLTFPPCVDLTLMYGHSVRELEMHLVLSSGLSDSGWLFSERTWEPEGAAL